MANAAVASAAAPLARFNFSSNSARFEIIIALGAPIIIASVNLPSAAFLSPSSSNSAAAPLSAFCLSCSSSASCLVISSPSGNGSQPSSSSPHFSSSSESSSTTGASSSLGASTCTITVAPSQRPSQSSNFFTSSSSKPASFVIFWCLQCAFAIIATRCFNMFTVACGSICTATVLSSILHFTLHCAMALASCAERPQQSY
mmetsp:Transcript_30680/g.77554  ORF Transcript_30680/g.77554 Transcript_30680/m.77554 type:complete len:201 (-) Transcript_30680:72-674(-)